MLRDGKGNRMENKNQGEAGRVERERGIEDRGKKGKKIERRKGGFLECCWFE